MVRKVGDDTTQLECRSTPIGPELVLFTLVTARSERSTRLTAAEWQVAGLAAAGLSNRTIAETRRCSVRTVGHQLASVYAKLGVSGRRELRFELSQGVSP